MATNSDSKTETGHLKDVSMAKNVTKQLKNEKAKHHLLKDYG